MSDVGTAKPTIYTSFYPLTYFVERIGGTHVDVVCPLPDDADPSTWRPTRDDIGAFQRADLIVLNGAGFERWAEQAVLPGSRVVVTAAPLADAFITFQTTTHSHGPAGDHTHAGVDGHTWLDPRNAIVQAEQILDAMTERFPEHAEAFASGFERLRTDLSALDAELGAIQVDGATILCSHPAYSYVARRYGWKITNLDLDPHEPIGARAWTRIVDAAGAAQSRVIMLWESPPLGETAATLESELGIRSVWFSPCETRPADDEDYLSIMRANVQRLSDALGD